MATQIYNYIAGRQSIAQYNDILYIPKVTAAPSDWANAAAAVDSLPESYGPFGNILSGKVEYELISGVKVPEAAGMLTRSSLSDTQKLMHAGLLDFSGVYFETLILNDKYKSALSDYANIKDIPFAHIFKQANNISQAFAFVAESFTSLEYYIDKHEEEVDTIFHTQATILNNLGSQASQINLQASQISQLATSIGSALNATEVQSMINQAKSEILEQLQDNVADNVFDYIMVFDDGTEGHGTIQTSAQS